MVRVLIHIFLKINLAKKKKENLGNKFIKNKLKLGEIWTIFFLVGATGNKIERNVIKIYSWFKCHFQYHTYEISSIKIDFFSDWK